MKLFHKQIAIVFILNLILLPCIVFSQENDSTIIKAYELIHKEYNLDAANVNGIYYYNTYKNNTGTPFFLGDKFLPGYIVIHNVKHNNQLLKYNSFEQNIVVQYTEEQGVKVNYMPPMDFISEFSMNNLIFRKHQFPGYKSNFYQEIYSGEIKCLYYQTTNMRESLRNGRYVIYDFSKTKHKSYLFMDNNLLPYNSKSSYLKLFPKKYKKEISLFIKKNQINVTKSSNQKIAELVSFCENLIKKNHLTTKLD